METFYHSLTPGAVLEDAPLRSRLLVAWLSGKRGPVTLARWLGIEPTKETLTEIQHIVGSPDFLREATAARHTPEATVIEFLKDRALKYALNLDALADECGDPRVQAQVNQDILNRIGAGATTKIAVGTLADYKRVLEEYSEPAVEESE